MQITVINTLRTKGLLVVVVTTKAAFAQWSLKTTSQCVYKALLVVYMYTRHTCARCAHLVSSPFLSVVQQVSQHFNVILS